MISFNRSIQQAVCIAALVVTLPACAQENLDLGKSPVQLFASDCAICHKSPQGLAKSGGLFGLESFLKQHYTASRETAAAIASYLRAVESGPQAPDKRTRRTARGSDQPAGKPAAKKPGEAKPAEVMPAVVKPAETKPAEAAPSEAKPIEAKVDAKPEVKPEAKPAEPKVAEPKASEPKSAEAPKPAESAKPAEGAKPE